MVQKKKFDIMDYFSTIRILMSIVLSLLVVFIIIFFVADAPCLPSKKWCLAPCKPGAAF